MSALLMAGLSMASSLLGSSSTDKSWKDSARKSGKNRAQLDASRARANSLLPAKAQQVSEAALAASLETQQNENAAVADATVAAAAAGAAGASVDQTVQEVEGNAARTKQGIDKARQAGMLQVNQDYEDIFWEAENQKYTVGKSGGGGLGRALLGAGLAGAGAYVNYNRP